MNRVAAGIIIRKEKVLLTRRGPQMSHAGYWEFPGGKVGDGETPEDCLKRELQDKLGILASVGELFTENTRWYSTGHVELLAFHVKVVEVNFKLKLYDNAEGVPLAQVMQYDILPNHVPVAQKVVRLSRG